MKRPILLRIGVLVHADDPQVDDRELNRIVNRLSDAINRELGTRDHRESGVQNVRQVWLDKRGLNCGKCAVCGTWVTDCEKPRRLLDLGGGAVVDGRLLCDEHLPPEHPWAF